MIDISTSDFYTDFYMDLRKNGKLFTFTMHLDI